MLYHIEVRGCDDTTHAILDLTDVEAMVVARVAAEVTSMSYTDSDCMPKMLVRQATESDIRNVNEIREDHKND